MAEESGKTVTREEFELLRGRVAALQGAIYLLFQGAPPDVALEALTIKARDIERRISQPFNIGFVQALDGLGDFLAKLDNE